MKIRLEQQQDHAHIAELIPKAFAAVERSDQTETAIVAALRHAGALTLSLVAEEKGELIGHIAFSPVLIDGKNLDWFGLGPVAVRPDRQGEGVGSALILQGLDRLRTRGAAGCVVLGAPAYYRRFGFENDACLRYEGAPAKYFMRLTLGAGAPAGRVDYHSGFGGH